MWQLSLSVCESVSLDHHPLGLPLQQPYSSITHALQISHFPSQWNVIIFYFLPVVRIINPTQEILRTASSALPLQQCTVAWHMHCNISLPFSVRPWFFLFPSCCKNFQEILRTNTTHDTHHPVMALTIHTQLQYASGIVQHKIPHVATYINIENQRTE